VAFIGFNAFNQVLAAQRSISWSEFDLCDIATVIVVFALIAMSLAIVGYDTIHVAQRVFAYLMIAILTVFPSAGIPAEISASQWDPAGFKAVPFDLSCLPQRHTSSRGPSMWSDYSRYLPRTSVSRASFCGPISVLHRAPG